MGSGMGALEWGMRLLGRALGPRQTYWRYEHSGTLSLIRFLYCLLTAITLAALGPDYDAAFARHVYDPIPFFRGIDGPPVSAALFPVVRWILVGVLLLAALGWFTRPALFASAVLFVVYEGTHLGFTKPIGVNYAQHMTNLTPFFLLILGLAPGVGHHAAPFPGREVRPAVLLPEWPRKAMIVLLVLAYFGAGFCRLRAGWRWIDGYTLQGYLFEKTLHWEMPWTVWLAQQWGLCVGLSVMTLVLELAWPLVLVFARARWPLVIGGSPSSASCGSTFSSSSYTRMWCSSNGLRSPAGSCGRQMAGRFSGARCRGRACPAGKWDVSPCFPRSRRSRYSPGSRVGRSRISGFSRTGAIRQRFRWCCSHAPRKPRNRSGFRSMKPRCSGDLWGGVPGRSSRPPWRPTIQRLRSAIGRLPASSYTRGLRAGFPRCSSVTARSGFTCVGCDWIRRAAGIGW